MRGKLTFAPFDENFDCFYTDVSIGILPYDYEICIKQPLVNLLRNLFLIHMTLKKV